MHCLSSRLVSDPSQVAALNRIFEHCPGYKKGIRGLLRNLRLTFVETMTNGGVAYDLDNGGRPFQMETFDQSPAEGCGVPIREFIETERLRKSGFEPHI